MKDVSPQVKNLKIVVGPYNIKNNEQNLTEKEKGIIQI